jgi:hypothetical protein
MSQSNDESSGNMKIKQFYLAKMISSVTKDQHQTNSISSSSLR